MTNIKLPYGIKEGELISINDVPKGLACNCFCPECQSPLVANKGKKKTHYFSHYRKSNCNNESLLHYLAKQILARKIEKAVETKKEIKIEWDCKHCHGKHEGNLIKVARSVGIEVSLHGCRPDLVLYNENREIIAFIEVVVSHSPEEHVVQYCQKNDISLIVIEFKGVEDIVELEKLDRLILDECSTCLAPKCPVCRETLERRKLHVTEVDCWKCKNRMKIAMGTTVTNIIYPEDLVSYDLKILSKFGVILKENFSKTIRERYISNTCGRCGSFIGKNFMHEYWHEVVTCDPVHDVFWCSRCEKAFNRGQ